MLGQNFPFGILCGQLCLKPIKNLTHKTHTISNTWKHKIAICAKSKTFESKGEKSKSRLNFRMQDAVMKSRNVFSTKIYYSCNVTFFITFILFIISLSFAGFDKKIKSIMLNILLRISNTKLLLWCKISIYEFYQNIQDKIFHFILVYKLIHVQHANLFT